MVGLNTALAIAPAPAAVPWPEPEPRYVTEQSTPTFSFFEVAIKTPSLDFAEEISEIFAQLSKGQEPLGPDFEAVWDDNLDLLYEA